MGWQNFFMQIDALTKTKKKHNGLWRGGIRRLKNWLRAMETDLQSAFDQVKGNDSCVCGTTAQNPTKATQDEILLRSELTTVALWRNKAMVLKTGHVWAGRREGFAADVNFFFPSSKLSRQNKHYSLRRITPNRKTNHWPNLIHFQMTKATKIYYLLLVLNPWELETNQTVLSKYCSYFCKMANSKFS